MKNTENTNCANVLDLDGYRETGNIRTLSDLSDAEVCDRMFDHIVKQSEQYWSPRLERKESVRGET